MLKGWKTLIAGALIAGLGTIQATDFAEVIPAEYTGLAMAVIGVLIIWLRKLTTTAIGRGE